MAPKVEAPKTFFSYKFFDFILEWGIQISFIWDISELPPEECSKFKSGRRDKLMTSNHPIDFDAGCNNCSKCLPFFFDELLYFHGRVTIRNNELNQT